MLTDVIAKRKIRCAYENSGELFSELSDFTYAVIKGEPLSCLAYECVGQRVSCDIDILVSRNDLNGMEAVLKKHGFRSTLRSRTDKIFMLTSSHQVSPWVKEFHPWGDLNLDLNFDIFWGEYKGKRVDMDEFLSDAIGMEIYGCRIKTLPPLKAMVQLILHHYKEMNSIYHLAGHDCINVGMFQDVYYLWKNNQEEISPERFCGISSGLGITPYAYYILYYTNQIFRDKGLSVLVEALETEEGKALLPCYGLTEGERKRWRVDFTTRLHTENLYEIIKDDLTKYDMEKLERNRRMFGE